MEQTLRQEDAFFTRADLRHLIIPLVIEQLLAITVGLADSLMVARVGEAAISAVSLVDTVNVLLINAFSALATGGAVVVGQYMGRRELDKASHSGEQLLLFMLEISLLVTVLIYVCKQFVLGVVFGQVEADVAAYAGTYYLIVEASIPFLALYNAGAALFRVMGNSNISMQVSLVMNGINVAGNALLIFGLHRGVEGVAVPTLVSRVVAAGMILMLLRRPGSALQVKRIPRSHDGVVIRNFLHFGVPNGVESSMFQLGKILLLSTVSGLGTASITANSIGNTIGVFQCIAGNAMGLAMVTVVSRCVGAGSYDQARLYTKRLLKMNYIYGLFLNLAILAALPLIIDIYGVSAEASAYATNILIWHGVVGIAIWPLAFTLPQALRAAGDTRFTMITSSLSMWIFRVAIGVVMARCWGFGVLGIWYAMFIDWVVRMAAFVLRFRGRRWEVTRLRD